MDMMAQYTIKAIDLSILSISTERRVVAARASSISDRRSRISATRYSWFAECIVATFIEDVFHKQGGWQRLRQQVLPNNDTLKSGVLDPVSFR